MIDRVDYGDLPTWLAAVGTIAAVVVALWLAGREGGHRRESERRHQAEQITAWMRGEARLNRRGDGMERNLVIQNASTQPAYMFIASLVMIGERPDAPVHRRQEFEYRVFMGALPPGSTEAVIGHGGGMGILTRFGVELAFTDARGHSWLRHAGGTLEELKTTPNEHYGLTEPIPWGDHAGP